MKNPAVFCRVFFVVFFYQAFALVLFVFWGGRLALSEVYRVIALLAPALTLVPSGVDSLAAI